MFWSAQHFFYIDFSLVFLLFLFCHCLCSTNNTDVVIHLKYFQACNRLAVDVAVAVAFSILGSAVIVSIFFYSWKTVSVYVCKLLFVVVAVVVAVHVSCLEWFCRFSTGASDSSLVCVSQSVDFLKHMNSVGYTQSPVKHTFYVSSSIQPKWYYVRNIYARVYNSPQRWKIIFKLKLKKRG